MAITASGLFGLTLEKMFIDTLGDSLEAEDNHVALITDSATPNFDTMDFWDDLSGNEVSGDGYTAGGQDLTGTEIAIGSPAAGQLRFDATDSAWTSSTISNAMALVLKRETGTASTDELVLLLDFVTAVSTTAGTLTVQYATNGLFYLDYTP